MTRLTVSHSSAGRLKNQARRYGVTQDQIAEAARVGRTLVSHVFAGRAKSGNVVATARRLIAARRVEQAAPSRSHRPRTGLLAPPGTPTPGAWKRSTARSLLKHATGWAGGDLAERLAEVSALRSRAKA